MATTTIGAGDFAPAHEDPRPGFFRRVFERIVEARMAEADRMVAYYAEMGGYEKHDGAYRRKLPNTL